MKLLILVLCLICHVDCFAEYEYLQPLKVYEVHPGGTGVGGMAFTQEEAIKLSVANFCKQSVRRNCRGSVIMGEYLNGSTWQYVVRYSWEFDPSYSTSTASSDWGMAISYYCPASFTYYYNPPVCAREKASYNPCTECDAVTVGNPIALGGGVKVQVENDYVSADGKLRFSRTYRSDKGSWSHNYTMIAVDFNRTIMQNLRGFCYMDPGNNLPDWRRNYCYRYISYNSKPYNFAVMRNNGRMLSFGTANDYLPSPGVNDRAAPVVDSAGIVTSWRVWNATNDTFELYNMNGNIVSITDRAGKATSYTYSDSLTPTEIAPFSDLLIQVADPLGRTLHFSYNNMGQLAQLTDPDGRRYKYAYDADLNLASVTYPDGNIRKYLYNEKAQLPSVDYSYSHALTGIVDENGVRYASFFYDTSQLGSGTEHAGGVNKYSVNYSSSTYSTVTDPLGTKRTYSFTEVAGQKKLADITQPTASGATVSSSIRYDTQGNVISRTGFDGTTTTYVYDLARNLETSRREATGSTVARTISTRWHSSYRLPLQIAEPKRMTWYEYDEAARVISRSEQATSDPNGTNGFSAITTGTLRTWKYVYNELGQLVGETGPRTDVVDTTIYTYDTNGNLATRTNPLGQTTAFSNYDRSGRVGRTTEPNGLSVDLTYTVRGWVSTRTVNDGTTAETTSYEYDGVGQLTKVNFADGSTLIYTYDPAHRLTKVIDSAGNSVAYTLDNAGNRISEQTTGSNGALVRNISRVFDKLNNLSQITGALQ